MIAVAGPRTLSGPRLWAPLSFVFLSIGLSMAVTFPFRTLFLTDAVHAGPVLVTLFLVVAPLSGVLAASLLGRLSDARPVRSRLIVATAVAGVLGCGVSAFVRDYWVLLLVTATAVAISTATLPQMLAYARIAVGTGEGGTFSVSVLRTLLSVSWVGGPFLAAILIDVGGYTLVFGVAAAIYAASAVVTRIGLPEPPREPVPETAETVVPPDTAPVPLGAPAPAAQPAPPTPTTVRDVPEGLLRLNFAGLVLLQTAATLGVQILPLFVNVNLDGNVRDTGFILGFCALLEIPLILAFGALADRLGVRRLFLIGPVVSASYFALVAVSTGTLHVGLAQFLNAAGIALIQGIGITYFQDLLPSRPGRASTLFSNAFPIGSTLAAPLLGLAQEIGYRFGFAAAAVLCVAGLFLLLARKVSTGTPAPRL